MKIITFLSDFGERDWFVAAVKGVILKINNAVQIIDITHQLPSFDIRSAAFLLKSVYKNFSLGTINLAVVDPGVGTERKPIIVESDGYYFVGPDNGIFSYIYGRYSIVYKIEVRKKPSATFHGRDIFGPIAAKLSRGLKPDNLGVRIKKYVKFEFPEIKKIGGKIYGEVIYIDHFGNLITNMENKIGVRELHIFKKRIVVKKFYGAGKKGEIICIKGSSGYYEIAGNKVSARKILEAEIGSRVTVM